MARGAMPIDDALPIAKQIVPSRMLSRLAPPHSRELDAANDTSDWLLFGWQEALRQGR